MGGGNPARGAEEGQRHGEVKGHPRWLVVGLGQPFLDLDPLRYLPNHEELGPPTPTNGFSMGALP